MSKLTNRTGKALLVIDVQNDVVGDAWKIVPELEPLPDESIIRKKYRSSFEETLLDETLANLGVGHLFISGAQSDNCVRHTSHAALERGYDVTLVEDAHTTSDGAGNTQTLMADAIVDEINRAFDGYELPGRSASIISTASVSF